MRVEWRGLVRIICALVLMLAFGASSASETRKVVRFGMLNIEKEATYVEHENIQQSTLAYLRSSIPDLKIEAKIYTIAELAKAIRQGEVDLFLSSSGFFVAMWQAGVKDLATLVSNDFPDPNHCVAGTFFVRADQKNVQHIRDLQGRRLVTTNPNNFMAYQIGLSEVARLGFDPDSFFSAVEFTNNDLHEVFRRVADGRADVGVLRSCMLEAMSAKYPEYRNVFRVVGPVDDSKHCVYSTQLYPGWVVAATKLIEPGAAEKVVKALFAKPPTPEGGYRWSVTTDYKTVNQVFERLRIGPYEHLKHPTVRDVVEKYWPVLAMLLVGTVAWILHWLSVERLVRRRTAELDAALQEQTRLKELAIASGEEVEHLTKLGIVNELSCIYAHEMAQPLTSIGYLAKTLELLTGKDAPDTALVRRCVGKIGMDLRAAESILERVRQYAKSPPSRNGSVDLRTLLMQVAQSVRNIHSDVELHVEADQVVIVRGDLLELRILVLNLLRNAARECRAIECADALPTVWVRLSAAADVARLEVRNRAHRPNVERIAGRLRFTAEPLQDKFGADKERGLGLGLLIVQTVTKAHHGRFDYAYDESKGEVVFTIALPLVGTTCSASTQGS